MQPLILASSSPRRQELLRQVGVSFVIEPSLVDERVDRPMAPADLVEHLALIKAREVASRHPESPVLGADTIVAIDGDILGKPADQAAAIAMLERLAGREHQVVTGVALVFGEREAVTHEVTRVRFGPLNRAQIERYVATGEPMDKAGAYGIQGRAAGLIEAITGDYYNVMGLPLFRTLRLLEQFDLHAL